MTRLTFSLPVPCLTQLRRDHPQWFWRAEHSGPGWRYLGIHRTAKSLQGFARHVIIYAESHLTPRYDGDDESCEVRWRVEDDARPHSTSFGAWKR